MGFNGEPAEAALVRTVRGLDHGDADTLPDRLDLVWDALEKAPRGSFHAAEEMLLRWLLKNMSTGPAANAARFRSSPRVWHLLSAVFDRIPLFSLAKSLADRRFVSILQQTLKDLTAPQPPQPNVASVNGGGPDANMPDAPPSDSSTNKRKRKRTEASAADNAAARSAPDSLQTAEAVFEAVRALLSRCDAQAQESVMYRMGAEHIKSLFSSPAAEAMGILVPWLGICNLVADRTPTEPLREQPSWLSTFSTLWELHLQGPGDATEVATHLSGPATRLLAKLNRGTPAPGLPGVETAVRDRWTRDLRRFLTRNLVLPARAAFLTKGNQEVVRITVEMSSPAAAATFPVLYDLVSKSPLEHGGRTSKKDYESWLQVVFDVLVHAAKNLNRDSKQVAVRALLELAADRSSPLSAASLRGVCNEYGSLGEDYDWSLLLSVVRLNPDVFLLTDAGKGLLNKVLAKTTQPESLSEDDAGKAAQFIVLIADGYAQGRDLPTFFRVWLEHLAPSKPKAGLRPLWAGEKLARTVAKLIQASLNPSQLAEVLDWLASQTQAGQGMARIHILDAISSGLSREEFVDAASMKTFEGVFLEDYSKKEPPAISARRWMVASRSIARGTLEEAGRIWSRIRSDIKSTLRKQPVDREDTLTAFKCCAAAWLAHYPGAEHEEDAAALLCSFVERLLKDGELTSLDLGAGAASAVSRETYVAWILSEAPRILGLLVDKYGKIPDGLLSLLTVPRSEDAERVGSALAVSRLLLDRESNVNNHKLMDLLVDIVISMIGAAKENLPRSQGRIAVQFLLDVPDEVLSRAQREAAMKSLVSRLPKESDADALDAQTWRLVLSLMIKLMNRPTFYEGMSFSHLVSIARCLVTIRDRNTLELLRHLAVLTVRQMTSGSLEEREKTYLKDAATLLDNSPSDPNIPAHVVLVHAFISTVQASPAAKKLEGDLRLDALRNDLCRTASRAVQLFKDELELDAVQDQLLQTAAGSTTYMRRTGPGLLALLFAIEALGVVDRQVVRETLASAAPSLLEASDALLEKSISEGWDLRMFLANYFPEALPSPLQVNMSIKTSAPAGDDDEHADGEAASGLGKTALLRYVDAVVQSADEGTKLGYLRELLLGNSHSQDGLGRLLVVYRLIQHLKGSRLPESPDQFSLAHVHNMLCEHLRQPDLNPTRFLLTAKAIRLLLDQASVCMTQWNIDLTLSTVAVVAAQATGSDNTHHAFPALARLVEMVIKRHRKRLDGHFHILISALQSLLRLLLSRPPPPPPPADAAAAQKHHHGQWERHARLFSRLLTLICEPTVASVSRSGGGGNAAQPAAPDDAAAPSTAVLPLDSDKDRARRYAGQHMYLVLMQYVRLQVEVPAQKPGQKGGGGRGAPVVVPRGVREALEPGVYSILDVTSQDMLRVLSDGLDAGGRVIFREMYKDWQRFGKWSGV
ncbi:hypothetical protein VTJ83DRAFT_2593 [Remersonia thermophila]|uniref:Nucleolar 27S pre-rRNA processing Urb2/Npa2 C-terminal domain-containing protein n=1 Tax=Remersonia thermophila TaxID=72144 RepID=A0ABR4DK71_9PEZI